MSLNADSPGRFLLKCKHIVIFTPPWPTKGQIVYCVRCVRYEEIMERIKEYRIQCTACPRYSRSFGTDRTGALQRADYHARTRGHDVILYRGQLALETIKGAQEDVIFS